MTRTYVGMKISEYPPPPPPWVSHKITSVHIRKKEHYSKTSLSEASLNFKPVHVSAVCVFIM